MYAASLAALARFRTSTSTSSPSSATATPPTTQTSKKRKRTRPTNEQMDIIAQAAIALGIDLKDDNTVMATAGRKIHDKLKETTLKGWKEARTLKLVWNKYNKKRRNKNEDDVAVRQGKITKTA